MAGFLNSNGLKVVARIDPAGGAVECPAIQSSAWEGMCDLNFSENRLRKIGNRYLAEGPWISDLRGLNEAFQREYRLVGVTHKETAAGKYHGRLPGQCVFEKNDCKFRLFD